MEINTYDIIGGVDLKIALVADLHNKPYGKVISALKKIAPDMIASPGDMTEPLNCDTPKARKKNAPGIEALRACASVAPTFYTLGNHEKIPCDYFMEQLHATGVNLLYNEYVLFRGAYIGGVISGQVSYPYQKTPPPDMDFVARFAALSGYKILISHHPEYYPELFRNIPVDLILSGHAHGGQWRFFGKGFFAPGQGFFPKYTSGVYDSKLIVSRGLSNQAFVPRINNPCEIVVINIKKKGLVTA